MPSPKKAKIHIGIGGWNYEPWRQSFYPQGLTQKRELEYASRKLTSIEINSTYYRSQTPDTFMKWHDETPADFVFAVKAPRFTTNRRVLAEAGESVERFFQSGVLKLGEKLGPVNWQFMPTKFFDPNDFEAFLKLLPKSVEGKSLRHAVEVRHTSFAIPEFVAMAREYGVAIVLAADSRYPQINDLTAPFVYLRLMGSKASEANGYTPSALDLWAERAKRWASGDEVDFPSLQTPQKNVPRDVFLYFISGYKEKNPLAGMALIERLEKTNKRS